MKNIVKLVVVLGIVVLAVFGFSCGLSGGAGSAYLATATPTPAAANTAANTSANAASTPPAGGSNKTITKKFTLAKDSLDEVHGEVPFDHDTHAFQKYSPDGTAVIGCVECHHTDQPKSALKAPLVTSERDVVLTLETWRASSQKVSECRACHFQNGDVPDGKEMPVLNGKDLNNELAYHLNCNTCHDEAFKKRPALASKPGFAIGKDCLKCHVKNS